MRNTSSHSLGARRDDIVQTFLNPGDAYKTSVLSGLAPSLILDIASRAMVSRSLSTRGSKADYLCPSTEFLVVSGTARAEDRATKTELTFIAEQVQQEGAFQALMTKDRQEVGLELGQTSRNSTDFFTL